MTEHDRLSLNIFYDGDLHVKWSAINELNEKSSSKKVIHRIDNPKSGTEIWLA